MKAEEKENVIRTLRNFSKVPSWNTTMTKNEVNFLFLVYSDTVFCNGQLRQIVATPLTDEVFKVNTIAL